MNTKNSGSLRPNTKYLPTAHAISSKKFDKEWKKALKASKKE